MEIHKNKIFVSGVIGLGLAIAFFIGLSSIKMVLNDRQVHHEHMYKLGASRALEVEGKRLFKQGRLQEALEKFQEANDPKYYLYEGHGNGYAEAYIREIYIMRGEYEKALENANKILALDYIKEMLKVEKEVGAHRLMEEKLEYEALIHARDTKSKQPIYDYIDFLKKMHAAELPPKGYDSIASLSPVATIFRLYDTIADYDAAISFVDEVLEWAYKTDKQIEQLKGQIKTSKEATACMLSKEKKLDPMACKWLREYLLVREAFEQDKAEGTKGRATKALIQSDYFPW